MSVFDSLKRDEKTSVSMPLRHTSTLRQPSARSCCWSCGEVANVRSAKLSAVGRYHSASLTANARRPGIFTYLSA